MSGVPFAYWAVVSFVFGAIVGSFLNVVIWRLPRRESLLHPGSHCPHCNRALAAFENVPLFSYLALRGRCRTCKAPISWRYFAVELLTAAVFLVIYLKFGPHVETIAYCLFAAALIAAFFTDLATFLIPDELNTFALLVGVGLDVWGIATHAQGHALIWGWLPRSIGGAVICAGVFVFIQIIGFLLFRKNAMGDGDVKLARAIGAMLPLSQAFVSFFLAIAVGAVLGVATIVFQALQERKSAAALAAESTDSDEDRDAEDLDEGSIPELLFYGLVYLTFFDLILQFGRWAKIKPIARIANAIDPTDGPDEEEPFVPAPRQIPFGPSMVLGAFLAVFVGDRIVQWYLTFAHILPPAG
jgi:leader peptidase (prepilin peptidase)/N-methyltransferase